MYTFHHAFAPGRDTLPNLRHMLAEWARRCGLSEPAVADVVVAAAEAIENALERSGNRYFVVEGWCDGAAVQVRVNDELPATGGDGKTVRASPADLAQRGLGVYLIRALTDESRFERRIDGGMTVTLKKKLEHEGPQGSARSFV